MAGMLGGKNEGATAPPPACSFLGAEVDPLPGLVRRNQIVDRALPWLAVVATLLLIALGVWLETKWRVVRERRKSRLQAKRGFQGEKDAEKIIKKLGYHIVSRQVSAGYAMSVDGVPQTIPLQADFVLVRDGKKYVAEAKTGKAAKLENADTRRQLLEYQLAFDYAEALLLIDADAKTVKMVRFPLPRKKADAKKAAKRATLRWALIGAAALTAVWILVGSESKETPALEAAPAKTMSKRHH